MLFIYLMCALRLVGNWMFFSCLKEFFTTKVVWLVIIHLLCQISITVPSSGCLLARSLLKKMSILKNAPCVFFLNDYQSNYHDLLNKSGTTGIKIMTLRLLVIDVYKCVNNFNPEYFYEMFTMKICPYDLRDTSILERPRAYATKYGLKSFRNHSVKIWNILSNNCKSAASLLDFKNMIKSWNGPRCKCSVCSIFLNWSIL